MTGTREMPFLARVAMIVARMLLSECFGPATAPSMIEVTDYSGVDLAMVGADGEVFGRPAGRWLRSRSLIEVPGIPMCV